MLYYDDLLTAESERPHWAAQVFFQPGHLTDEVIEKFGLELLQNTSCKEPFLMNIYGIKEGASTFRTYGSVWLEE